jgi:membrane protein
MLQEGWRLVRRIFDDFLEDEALTRGAAIAFYAVTAVAPVLYIVATVAGLIFGGAAARHAIGADLGNIMSRDSVALLDSAIRNAQGTSTGILHGLIGLVTLILTASGVFGEMEDALNIIWKAPRKGPVIPRLLRGRAVSLGLVIGLGILLTVSMIATSAITALGNYIDFHTRFSEIGLNVFNFVVSFSLTALLFAAIYRIIPNTAIEWRDVIGGAMLTALLFQIGQLLLGYYLGNTSVSASYGVAGGLIALLIWAYYSAQVFLLGAEFTKSYAQRFGSKKAALNAESAVSGANIHRLQIAGRR